jgi:hypothetical protein
MTRTNERGDDLPRWTLKSSWGWLKAHRGLDGDREGVIGTAVSKDLWKFWSTILVVAIVVAIV